MIVCIYMSIRMSICTYMYVYDCIYICRAMFNYDYTHMSMCLMYMCMPIHIGACVCVNVLACVCVCIYMFVQLLGEWEGGRS